MNQSADQQIIAAGAEVLREGAAHLEGAAARLGDGFVATVRALAAPDSFTMVVGAGKSGYIGRKFAASMLSTGHGAAFLHPTDALHGDIGIAEHASLAILLSHSGRTDELVTLIPAIKQFGISAALITRRADCPLADYVDWIVETGVEAEAGIGRVAPTSSSTATLALCDALMMASLSAARFLGATVPSLPSGRRARPETAQGVGRHAAARPPRLARARDADRRGRRRDNRQWARLRDRQRQAAAGRREGGRRRLYQRRGYSPRGLGRRRSRRRHRRRPDVDPAPRRFRPMRSPSRHCA